MGVGLTNSVNWKCLTSNKQNIVEGMAPELGHKKDSFCLAFPPSHSQVSWSGQTSRLSWGQWSRPVGEYAWRGICMCAKSLQLCSTLCNPMDCTPPGSSVHGILQARILEWVALFSSSLSIWPRDWIRVSYVFFTGRWFFTTGTIWEDHMEGNWSQIPTTSTNLTPHWKWIL